ncbi:hypothetical protein TNCT_599931 [Trichonephila clavata]|uniref:Uncharacterized protein n=1 Tax=Trichonephila clavata TaxID=2740835 RepID=A0A8X6M615_TRICU|nr:hypothetical protein TNCT_599931 [Trichonephila clavata]
MKPLDPNLNQALDTYSKDPRAVEKQIVCCESEFFPFDSNRGQCKFNGNRRWHTTSGSLSLTPMPCGEDLDFSTLPKMNDKRSRRKVNYIVQTIGEGTRELTFPR